MRWVAARPHAHTHALTGQRAWAAAWKQPAVCARQVGPCRVRGGPAPHTTTGEHADFALAQTRQTFCLCIATIATRMALHHARGAGSGQAGWHASALAHLLCSCSRSSATISSSSGSSQLQQQQWGDGEPQAEEESRQFSHFGSSSSSSSSSSQQHGGAWAQQHSSTRALSTSPAACYDRCVRPSMRAYAHACSANVLAP